MSSEDHEFSLRREWRVKAERSPRRRMAFRGMLETVTGTIIVAVKNISCTGAMIEGEDMPPAGWDGLLTTQGLELFGRVVWSDGTRCGLEFDEPLAQEKVLELHRITPEQLRKEDRQGAPYWNRNKHRFDY